METPPGRPDAGQIGSSCTHLFPGSLTTKLLTVITPLRFGKGWGRGRRERRGGDPETPGAGPSGGPCPHPCPPGLGSLSPSPFPRGWPAFWGPQRLPACPPFSPCEFVWPGSSHNGQNYQNKENPSSNPVFTVCVSLQPPRTGPSPRLPRGPRSRMGSFSEQPGDTQR